MESRKTVGAGKRFQSANEQPTLIERTVLEKEGFREGVPKVIWVKWGFVGEFQFFTRAVFPAPNQTPTGWAEVRPAAMFPAVHPARPSCATTLRCPPTNSSATSGADC